MTNEQLFYKNVGLVHWYFNKFLKKYTKESEDLLQEGYLGLWKACLNWDRERKFSTFAVHIIRNQMLYYLRRLRRTLAYSVPNSCTEDENGNTIFDVTPEDLCPFREEELNLDYYLKTIKPKKAEIYKLFCKGYTRQEVADIMGITRQALYATFWSTAEKIKDNMSDGWSGRILCPLYQPGEHKASVAYAKLYGGKYGTIIYKAKLKENNFSNYDARLGYEGVKRCKKKK